MKPQYRYELFQPQPQEPGTPSYHLLIKTRAVEQYEQSVFPLAMEFADLVELHGFLERHLRKSRALEAYLALPPGMAPPVG